MNLIKASIMRPVAVISVVAMVILFGLVALKVIPIQLTPDVNQPVISITTAWPGAAPAEIEREIANRQEEALRGLNGMERMSSSSVNGWVRITLEFRAGHDMNKALLLVSNRLDRITGYPNETQEPVLDTAGADDSPIAWLMLTRLPGNSQPIHTFGDFSKDVVEDRLERVQGVAAVQAHGDSERRLEVIVDPARMARYQLTVSKVVQALREANVSASVGDVEEGKRRYTVRTEGELTTVDKVRAVVIRSIDDKQTGRLSRITVGDIADVDFGYTDIPAIIEQRDKPAISFGVMRETGANVITTMEGIQAAVEELNNSILPEAGLELNQVYDETIYIDSAINLVRQNIWIGGFLAALVLLLFLRSGSATLIVAMAIPISVIGSFVAMWAMGRTINVISLAGLAFAIGMVADAAIIVLENIYRLRQKGKTAGDAAFYGASQVWGAVMVSALTTVLVFAPVLVMKLEVGQLFRDIAVAISVSVLLSLIVAVTVIPALSNRLLRGKARNAAQRPLPGIDHLARAFVAALMRYTHVVVHNRVIALAMVVLICGATSLATWAFLPQLEYLPTGNRNFVFGAVLPPPGYNLETSTGITSRIQDEIRPLWAAETGPESGPGEPPKIDSFFIVTTDLGRIFLGAAATDPDRVGELIPILREPILKEPGTFGFITQPSLFGRSVGGGRSIDVDISGPDLGEVLGVALKANTIINTVLPRKDGNQLQPKPGLELGAPEVRVYPDPLRLADNGITAREFATAVDAFNDGLRVAEITVDGKRIDLTLKAPSDKATRTQGIENLPVVTRDGKILPVRSLADVKLTAGPTQIRHIERKRTVTLEVRPRADLPLETAMEILQKNVLDKLSADGLPANVDIRLSGTADKLTKTWNHMIWSLLLAIAIVYLAIAVLFESFVYPFVIMLSVPLAAAGGIGGLAVLNMFSYQPLDMLTLLGFIILVGIVVNNAILLVHQTLHQQRDGMPLTHAIQEATKNRIRPIFMSTLTSVFGMLPLVIFPGPGSELYRGLGSVVVGGLSLSALLTLVIIPPLLALAGHMVKAAPSPETAVKAD